MARICLAPTLAWVLAVAGCTGQADSGHTDSGQTDTGQTGSWQGDSGHTDSGQIDSGQAESGQADSGHAGSGQIDSGHTDSGQTGSKQPDSGPTDSGKTGDAIAQDANGAVCVTSAAKGSCGPYLYPAITASDGSNSTVGQDVWNPISGWSQTLYATNPGNWYVTANMPAGNTAVVSFPNTGESYNSPLLSNFTSMDSSFSENMSATAGTSAEAAYDIWLNNWKNEVMIQHDMVNRGGPCGPVLATTSFGGQRGVPVQNWNLCQYGSELIWQVPGNGNVYGEQSGSVDILAMLSWLENHGGYLPKGSSLTAIGYGFEICSTGGADENFQVTGFSITSSP
jgi:hypothetical protein